ncbi:Rz1-like lysis system protein LysC [Aquisediminimonas sediminicola]|uniref:Rz1-like lysis system protein LysC n=1 Tax=Alteraquisediminimonas sediminicola TaxID=2676787 RepID=UPI003CCE9CA7
MGSPLLERLWPTTRIGLLSLSLLLSLTACGKREHPALLPPPQALIEDCPETSIPLETTGDLVLKVRSLRVDLSNCNADKGALRIWAQELSK